MSSNRIVFIQAQASHKEEKAIVTEVRIPQTMSYEIIDKMAMLKLVRTVRGRRCSTLASGSGSTGV